MDQLFIPNTSVHNVVSYDILIEGNAISITYQVLSISVTREMNRMPAARIVLRDGNAPDRTFAASEQDDFIPGKNIKIKIGRDGTNTQVFQGVIVKQSIRVKENGNGELVVECRDVAMKMAIGRHSKYFDNVKDSDLFDDLVGQYKELKSDVETTHLTHKELVQHHISDWDFMLLRAEANGMLVNVVDGKIQIATPKTDGDPVLEVAYGSSILEFEAEMDVRNQWKNVEARSWDYPNQQLFKANTSSTAFNDPGNISGATLADANGLDTYEMHHSGYLLEQELQDWVNGLILRSRLAKICGRAKFTGFSGVIPGNLVKVTGVGGRFSGNVFVTAVRHEVVDGIWDTHVQFGLDPSRYGQQHSDLNDLHASGLMGSINGLQVGIVVKLENDPDGQDRIMVKIPTIDFDASGIWTRVACLDAGKNRGSFFRPEIGDEVIVGFINNDPRNAVTLGMLNSSAKPAPITAKDANDEKGFITRSNMRIHFNDQTKTIIIDTPAGNSITLDEANTKIAITDQNQNEITMDTDGITLNSPMNISIQAGADLSLSAGASLSISGVSISLDADSSMQMQGAMVQLSSQGIAAIQGQLVTIN